MSKVQVIRRYPEPPKKDYISSGLSGGRGMRSCRKADQEFSAAELSRNNGSVWYLAEHTSVGLPFANIIESCKEGWSSVSGEIQGLPNPFRSVPCLDLCYGPEADR